MKRDLDLAPIGNCAISALIDRSGSFVWCCPSRIDGDPFFSNLLGVGEPTDSDALGLWSVEVEGRAQISAGLSAKHADPANRAHR